jgi:hypothetical protein
MRALGLVLLLGTTVRAAGPGRLVYRVDSTADEPAAALDGTCVSTGDGTCTLRAAVMAANHAPNPSGLEVLIHVPVGRYELTRNEVATNTEDCSTVETCGALKVLGRMTVLGAGMDRTAIVNDRSYAGRGFAMSSGAALTLIGASLEDFATVELGETARPRGGAILNDGGDLKVVDVAFRRNVAYAHLSYWLHLGRGGAIFSSGTLTVEHCLFEQNGPGVEATDAVIRDSTFVRNVGPAITAAPSHRFAALNTTIADPLESCAETFCPSSVGVSFAGTHGCTEELDNVTITGNAYGIAVDEGDGPPGDAPCTLTIRNSIVWGNAGDVGGRYTSCPGCARVASNGFNLIRSVHWTLLAGRFTGAYSTADPLLGQLRENGGPVPGPTRFPGPGSPAIDAGDPAGCLDVSGALLATDQRGVKRPIGARCDLGAVEVDPTGDVDASGVVDVRDVFYLVDFLFTGGPAPIGRADVNGDGRTDIADLFYLVEYLLAGGPAPVW